MSDTVKRQTVKPLVRFLSKRVHGEGVKTVPWPGAINGDLGQKARFAAVSLAH